MKADYALVTYDNRGTGQSDEPFACSRSFWPSIPFRTSNGSSAKQDVPTSLDWLNPMQHDIRQINGYHAHIYYDESTRSTAADIRERLASRFKVTMGRWRDEPVGPHPQSMYQVAFPARQFHAVVAWLMLNHAGLPVLIHPNTKDHVADHSERALWLGKRLKLNLKFLRDYQKKEKQK